MRIRNRVLLALVAVLLVAGACSNDDGTSSSTPSTGGSSGSAATGDRSTFVPISGVPGVTDDSISYAIIGTKANNPLGTCILDCYDAGVKAYFDYQNSEFDGIYGRQLEIGATLDDELANNQARSIEVISGGNEFGVFVATLVAAGYGDLNDAGVPTYGWGIHATEVTGREAIFPSQAPPLRRLHLPRRFLPAQGVGEDQGGRPRLRRQRELQGLCPVPSRRLREVRRRDRRRGRVLQRRPRLRPAQRHRSGGHGHEERRRRVRLHLHGPQRHEDHGPGAPAPGHGRRGARPPEHLQPGVRRRGRHHLRGRLRHARLPSLRGHAERGAA